MKLKWIIATAVAVIFLGLIGVTAISVWILPDPNLNPVARLLPFPVVCSTRGCITTRTWHTYSQLANRFAAAAGTSELTRDELLTTLARQHLVSRTQLKSPVAREDAERYRQEILNLSQDDVSAYSGLSAAEYDEFVVWPLLQQENVRQYRNAETTADLYRLLASERRMFVFPVGLWWDKSDGSVKSD